MNPEPNDASRPAGPDRASEERSPADSGPLMLHAADLFKTGPEILIEHNGDIYRLRLTGRGKLILNK